MLPSAHRHEQKFFLEDVYSSCKTAGFGIPLLIAIKYILSIKKCTNSFNMIKFLLLTKVQDSKQLFYVQGTF